MCEYQQAIVADARKAQARRTLLARAFVACVAIFALRVMSNV